MSVTWLSKHHCWDENFLLQMFSVTKSILTSLPDAMHSFRGFSAFTSRSKASTRRWCRHDSARHLCSLGPHPRHSLLFPSASPHLSLRPRVLHPVVHRPCQCWAWDIGWLIKSSYPYIRMSEMWGCYEMYLVAESLRIWNLGSHTIYNTFESDSELTIFWFVDHNFFLPWLQLGDTVRSDKTSKGTLSLQASTNISGFNSTL